MTLACRWAWPAALALLVSGCAGYSPSAVQPGMGAAELQRLMGPSTGRHALADGSSRLEFARGPQGLHTYMVDLDAEGRVTRWDQVLGELQFQSIEPGTAREDLLRRLGRPAFVRAGGWQPGEVWTYRFDDVFCRWWEVEVIDGRVRGAGFSPDPRCERNIERDLP
jgi:hypothetical protein